ncbi:MAG TPA: DUF3347 domain-containing protein [Parafilimonas sp.]|nr:DUF3347 domain-containing protein [Parafilimonas sp.]
MKAIIPGIAMVAALFAGCSTNNSSNNTAATSADTITTNNETAAMPVSEPASVDAVVNDYLTLKNALANDNGSNAADAGKQMMTSLQKLDAASLNADQKKVYDDVKDDMKEHAEHISTNASNIEHQREHFDMLSKDMYDLVKAVKPAKTLYQDHCPMYNDNKGANWLSETKEIKNPYLGKKMPDCGTVKEEIKQ